jgi:predicted phosphate transport protein (TIGR00153 family)
MDSIADSAEDVGVLSTFRTMEVPDEMKPLLGTYIDRVLETVDAAARLVAMLPLLLETAFRGKPVDEARTVIQEIAEKEHEADKVQDQLTKILFKLEGTLSPVSIFMWMKVLNEIGDMANHAENVGDQFRLFIAR